MDYMGLRYYLYCGIDTKTVFGDSGSSVHSGRGGSNPSISASKNSRPSWDGCFFAVAFLSAACYTFGVYARAERNILSQGGYEDEEKILDRDTYRRAAAESSAGDDAVGGGGRYVIDGD